MLPVFINPGHCRSRFWCRVHFIIFMVIRDVGWLLLHGPENSTVKTKICDFLPSVATLFFCKLLHTHQVMVYELPHKERHEKLISIMTTSVKVLTVHLFLSFENLPCFTKSWFVDPTGISVGNHCRIMSHSITGIGVSISLLFYELSCVCR